MRLYISMTDIVIKFGGTSVRKNPKNIVDIVCNKLKQNKRIILVLSALSNITNLLHKLYETNKLYDKLRLLRKISQIHKLFLERYHLKKKVYILRDLNFLYDKLLDIILSNVNSKYLRTIIITFGEKFSVTIYKHIFDECNILNLVIWSELLITTNNYKDNSFPLLDKSRDSVNKILGSKKYKQLIITTGYVARDVNGNKTNLGRNGSDFTATILASVMNIENVEIYTDVDGILTGDPMKIKNTKLIKRINYKQISEMCYFGAKVLHPKTLIPLKNKSINVFIKNTFNPNNSGTLITEYYKSTNILDAITSIDDSSLLTIKGHGMLGVSGIAYKLFKTLVKYNISTSFITQASSEQTICISINNDIVGFVYENLLDSFSEELELGQIENIDLKFDIAIITVIGTNMINKVGIAGKIFTVLGDNNINIIAISQGTSEISISFVVKYDDEIKALEVLHNEFL